MAGTELRLVLPTFAAGAGAQIAKDQAPGHKGLPSNTERPMMGREIFGLPMIEQRRLPPEDPSPCP